MRLNPLDLSGPAFLLFYIALLACAALLVRLLSRSLESSLRPVDSLAEDPYRIAMLRGGDAELILTAVVSLVERGLAKHEDGGLFLADPTAAQKVRRPLDKAILSRLHPSKNDHKSAKGEPVTLESLANDRVVGDECQAVRDLLITENYLPDSRTLLRRRLIAGACVLGLWALALAKTIVALSRGHHNLGFLAILSVATPFVLLAGTFSRRTQAGDLALGKIQGWYAKLRDDRARLTLGQTSSELTYLAAVYGSALLPIHVAAALPPPPRKSSNWDSSFGGGSSDTGSSSSCSGGSSCGGGGGCGGCGGGGD